MEIIVAIFVIAYVAYKARDVRTSVINSQHKGDVAKLFFWR